MKRLKESLTKGNLLLYTRRKLDERISVFFRKFFYSFGRVKNNKLFVMTYNDAYCDNQKYIVEEILRQKLPVEIVWAIPKKGPVRGTFPQSVKLVKRGSFEMFEEMSDSKVWLDNALNCVWYDIPKKRSQVYINTWHGSMGIKKISGSEKWMKKSEVCKSVTDYCISNSKFEENVYETTFWSAVPVLKYGHARNDILFDKSAAVHLRETVLTSLGISSDKKLALYAPTFRDDGNIKCFNLNYEDMKLSLEKRFGGEWVILVRLHYKNRKSVQSVNYNDCIIDASGYLDMQELLVSADVGITDYSSWAYDFILTGKPMFIYACDIEKYDNDRGFYYPLNTTPFPVADDNVQMCENILSFDSEKYCKEIDIFLKNKGCYECGNSAKRTVEKIKEIMNI